MGGRDIGDHGIRKAPALVEFADLLLVFLRLGGRESACMGKEGENIGRLGLHHLEKILRKNGVVTREAYPTDHKFWPLVDLESDSDFLVGKLRSLRLDFHIRVIAVFVKLENFLAVLIERGITQGTSGLGRDLFPDLGGGNGFGSLDEHFSNRRATLQENRDLESSGHRFRKDAGIGDATRRVE